MFYVLEATTNEFQNWNSYVVYHILYQRLNQLPLSKILGYISRLIAQLKRYIHYQAQYCKVEEKNMCLRYVLRTIVQYSVQYIQFFKGSMPYSKHKEARH